MDHDHVGPLGDVLKCVGDRILPPGAANDDPQRLRRLTQVGGRFGGDLGRQRDNHVTHVRMREECRDGALENLSPADPQELLGGRRTEPPAASTSRNDGCHKYRMRQTLIIPARSPDDGIGPSVRAGSV